MENHTELLSTMQPFLQEAWNKAGFKEMTAVQQKTIPVIFEGKDMIAESPTGTGKTLAYLLPLLERINSNDKNTQAVILAPTRELVMQIHQEIQKFAEGSDIYGAAFIGGADIKRQIEKLKKHPQIVVGTPGRVFELIKAKKLKMHEVKTIVVDEADQMMDMGFMSIVKDVVKTTLKDRQLLFFSATIPEKIEQVGRDMLNKPEVIRINRAEIPKSQVEHIFFVCEKRDKTDVLRRLVRMQEIKALAFVNDTVNIEELAAKLTYLGIPFGVIHGQADKTDRETVIKNFRSGKIPLLVASDIAARGLDIEDITHVIHLDLPQEVDKYVHRSGRTGRMGAAGTVVSIVTKFEESTLKKFAEKMNIPVYRKEMYMGEIVDSKPHRGKQSSEKKDTRDKRVFKKKK